MGVPTVDFFREECDLLCTFFFFRRGNEIRAADFSDEAAEPVAALVDVELALLLSDTMDSSGRRVIYGTQEFVLVAHGRL